MLAKARVTITLDGKYLDVVEQMAKATGKKRGDIVHELFYELLDGLIPALNAPTQELAWKELFRSSLLKINELLDEEMAR